MKNSISTMTEYKCEACGGTFSTTWPDEEAVAEAETIFGERPDTHDMGIVCDDCFLAMGEWYGWTTKPK